MSHIGWDDQGSRYTAWDRIRDERRAEAEQRNLIEAAKLLRDCYRQLLGGPDPCGEICVDIERWSDRHGFPLPGRPLKELGK